MSRFTKQNRGKKLELFNANIFSTSELELATDLFDMQRSIRGCEVGGVVSAKFNTSKWKIVLMKAEIWRKKMV